MAEIRQRRVWFLIAAIAIAVLLCLLLVQQTHTSSSAVWLAILPVFFIGLLFPLGTPRQNTALSTDRVLESPFHRSSFQRPPPIRLG